jgi:hypothetical protein
MSKQNTVISPSNNQEIASEIFGKIPLRAPEISPIPRLVPRETENVISIIPNEITRK